MSKSIAPISRREVLIGGAAAVAVAGFPLPAAIGQPNLAGASCAGKTNSRRDSHDYKKKEFHMKVGMKFEVDRKRAPDSTAFCRFASSGHRQDIALST